MFIIHMSQSQDIVGGATSERNRLKRHSYEEVDIDWPKDDATDGKVPKHSYEEVDFNHSENDIIGGSLPLDAGQHRADTAARGQGPVRINLSHTIRRLRMCGWYWGDISSEQAKEVLRRTQNGSFILRDSSDACHLFTLSLKANNIIVSVRVAFSRGLFKLDSWNQEDSPSFNSVVDMIEYYLEDESHEFYVELPNIGEFPVCLKHPIWKEVPDLQHLCRTTVVKYCRTSNKLRLLPLPPHLIRYVLEFSPEDENGTKAAAAGGGGGEIENSRGTISEDSSPLSYSPRSVPPSPPPSPPSTPSNSPELLTYPSEPTT